VTVSCGDGARTIAPPRSPPPVAPITPSATRLRGTADFTTGTLTFESMPPATMSLGATNGIDRAIYGNQGVTVKIYNSAVTVANVSATKKTFTANVGLRNLEAFRIGDEQGAAAPLDTMGIYAFIDAGPTVTSISAPCVPGPCTVTAFNYQGTLNFNAPSQRYWFWPELLGPHNGGKDTTLVRKQWVFQADKQVTAFTFDVLVSAAWVAPNDPTWKIDYPGDSLPDQNAEPLWNRVNLETNPGSAAATGDTLSITITQGNSDLRFARYDSVLTSTNAFMQATLRFASGHASGTVGTAGFMIDDATRTMYVAMSTTTVGFTGLNLSTFVGPTFSLDATQLHTYVMRKYAADSVVLLVDGVRQLEALYTTFPTTATTLIPIPGFYFGSSARTISAVNVTNWGHVIYQIGKATP
jgi:hypothetical protein